MPWFRGIISLVLIGCCASGCATLQLPWGKDQFAKAGAQNPVVQIVCLWEQAEGRDPDNVPCRGFAGQIMFLGNRHATPVEIEGDIRIYLFDDVGTVEEQSKPLHQFDFNHDAWKIHLSKSAVGPSYSVFVPYTRRGQHNPKCSLRVRLTPKVGPTIFSEMTTLPLRNAASLPEATIVSETPPEEVRVQKEVQKSMSRLTEKSSTIPLTVSGSGRLAIDRKASADVAPSSPVEAESADDRLARMEKLMEQLLTEKDRTPQEPKALSSIQQAGFEEPATDPAGSESARRFKLQRSESP